MKKKNDMKLTVKHMNIRSTDALDSWVEAQISSLEPKLRIDEANVRLVKCPEGSPAYQAHVHIVTPGPDLFAESSDHTLRAAVNKVMKQLDEEIVRRLSKRRQKLKSNLSGPAEKTRCTAGR